MESKLIFTLVLATLGVAAAVAGLRGLFRMLNVKNRLATLVATVFFMTVAGVISLLLCCEHLTPHMWLRIVLNLLDAINPR